MYDLSIFVQGYPGKSKTHGGLGWSTIALLSSGNRHILVDSGSFGVRHLILSKLKQKGLHPDDITDVLLTHTHWDHSVNWLLFPKANIYLSRTDLEWALNEPPGGWHVPEFYIKELSLSPQLRLIHHLDEIIPGISVHEVAGHTPGHVAYRVENENNDIIFSGDAAKNRAELLSRNVDMTLNLAESKKSIDYLWELWKRKEGSILVPGHDIPMILEDEQPKYLAKREASLEAWLDPDLNEITTFTLNV